MPLTKSTTGLQLHFSSPGYLLLLRPDHVFLLLLLLLLLLFQLLLWQVQTEPRGRLGRHGLRWRQGGRGGPGVQPARQQRLHGNGPRGRLAQVPSGEHGQQQHGHVYHPHAAGPRLVSGLDAPSPGNGVRCRHYRGERCARSEEGRGSSLLFLLLSEQPSLSPSPGRGWRVTLDCEGGWVGEPKFTPFH